MQNQRGGASVRADHEADLRIDNLGEEFGRALREEPHRALAGELHHQLMSVGRHR